MNVIVCIPKELRDDTIVRQFTDILTQQLGDSCVVAYSLSLHKVRPSLVHILGCGTAESLHFLTKAQNTGVPTLVSPLDSLNDWNQRPQVFGKGTHTLPFQEELVKGASAIHVCNQIELETLRRLDWNPNLVLIPNPVITNTLTDKEFADKMSELYQKVLDSNPQMMMDATEQQTVFDLLNISVDDIMLNDKENKARIIDNLDNLSEESWRHISLYAERMFVLEDIRKALRKLNRMDPMPDLSQISHFTNNAQRPARLELPANTAPEDGLAQILLQVKSELRHHATPLYHLIDLYQLFRYTDYDEDRLVQLLDKSKSLLMTRRLTWVLHETLKLTEGFMPLTPLEDAKSHKMLQDYTLFR